MSSDPSFATSESSRCRGKAGAGGSDWGDNLMFGCKSTMGVFGPATSGGGSSSFSPASRRAANFGLGSGEIR